MVDRTPIVVVADADDEGQRADVVLARHHRGLSRRVARELALRGRLRVDGRRCPPSTRVHAGSRLELRIEPSTESPPPLVVLACTERFVYVDKPAGVHTHRLGPQDPPALSDAVAALHPECAEASEDPREGGAVHRLDAATSGVIAFARNRRSWEAGRAAVTAGAVKIYLAVVGGPSRWPPTAPSVALGRAPAPALPDWAPPPSQEACVDITAPLGPGAQAREVAVRPDGLPAHSRVWRLRSPPNAEGPWVAISLLTGRRHQARVHLASAGYPILGDALYGGLAHPRLLLHAAVLQLDAEDGPVFARAPAGWPDLNRPCD
jgi:23S rRNA pseudouridine1911/1915/1917 synthase